MTQDHAAAIWHVYVSDPHEPGRCDMCLYLTNMADAALKLEQALNDVVKGYAIYGEQPPQMYLDALAAIEQARKA